MNIEETKEELMEEIVKIAKEEATAEMSTRMIYLELSRMPKDGRMVGMAREWMDKKYTPDVERSITIRLSKYYLDNSSKFEEEYAVINTLHLLKNNKFDGFLGIVRDVRYICE